MEVSRDDFRWAVSKGFLSAEQADTVWAALEARRSPRAAFDLAHLAYYFGALIVIGAMGFFMTLGWERFGGGGIFVISALYALSFVLAGRRLWYRDQLRVPGGLLFTMAVCMTPLAVYGLERSIGIWPQGDPGAYRGYYVWVKGSWFLLEVATIAAGLVALRFIRFPFLTAPIAFSLWFMSMDLTPLIFGKPEFSWHERLWVSLAFGLVVLVVSYLIDRQTRDDYAFWGYLFGMLAFWGGLSLMQSAGEVGKFFYGLINVALMVVSILLQRRVFMVFGALGVFGYLGYLSYRVFENSMLFPFALTLVGLAIIYLGIKYQRNREAIEQTLLAQLPSAVLRALPVNRMD